MPDYSCYIQIRNNTSINLNFVGKNSVHGEWQSSPDNVIVPGTSSSQIQLKDSDGETHLSPAIGL